MSGFQPISYGEAIPDININTDDIIQKLNNIQTYSSLLLNNTGISVDTSLVLPEFIYEGALSQTGYTMSYGITVMNLCRNYDYIYGFDMTNISNNNYLEVKFSYNNIVYTSYPVYTSYGYFYSDVTYYCPLKVYIAENGIFTTNFVSSEGHCGIKFTLDEADRAPVMVYYVSGLKTKLII